MQTITLKKIKEDQNENFYINNLLLIYIKKLFYHASQLINWLRVYSAYQKSETIVL